MPPGILMQTSTTLRSETWTTLSRMRMPREKREPATSPRTAPRKSSRWLAEGIPNLTKIRALIRAIVSPEWNMKVFCFMLAKSLTNTGVERNVVREMVPMGGVSALRSATVSLLMSSASPSEDSMSDHRVRPAAETGAAKEEAIAG